MNEEKKIELLIFGHVRELEVNILRYSIPKSLLFMIITFYEREWKFIDMALQNCSISEDGLSVSTTTDDTFISVRFGEFFSNKNNMKYKFKIKMGIHGQCGIGFITKTFKDFSHNDYNDGGNHSMVLYSNGYYVTSKTIEPSKTDTYCDWYSRNWCHSNDEIMVKINTNSMKVLIWNYSVLGITDIEFEKYDENNRHQHLLQLAMDQEIALIAEIGCDIQTISVLHQTFQYD